MKTAPILLAALAAVALVAQTVKLDQDGKTLDVTGDATVATLATNLFTLTANTIAPIKLPHLALAQIVTNHITSIKFDDGIRLVTNSTDTNIGWWLYFDNGVTNGFVPLTNGVIKP